MKPYIFVHINKTGGTSVKKALNWPYRNYQYYKHECIECIRNRMNEKRFYRAFKFCFIRHPLSRVVSMYHYRDQTNKIDDLSFQEWFDLVFVQEDQSFIKNPIMCKPCLDWITINGEIGVDFIGRVESMQEDWQKIQKQLNIKSKLPVLNSSNHQEAQTYFTGEMRAVIGEKFKKDYEFY